MARSCPVGAEWDAIVEELKSEDNARFAWEKFLKTRAGVGEFNAKVAREIIEETLNVGKDELENRSSTDYKMKKAAEQLKSLAEIHNKTTNKFQRKTLKKLHQATSNYAARLQFQRMKELTGEGVKPTISVSNFVGGSEFNEKNAALYEAYRQMGNFMHNLLEFGQIQSNATGKNIVDIMNKDWFDAQWEQFTKKNPIAINNLDPDILYDLALDLAMQVGSFRFADSVIIPEITIMGKSDSGSDIVGRLDLIIIDAAGKVNILDFKTKKLKNLFTDNPITKEKEENLTSAFAELGDNRYALSKNKKGTSPEFYGIKRSAFDNWMVQLDVYENMLRQQGVDVGQKAIATYLYQVSEDNNYEGGVIKTFTDQQYYERSLAILPDKLGEYYSKLWYLNETTKTNHINDLKSAVNRAIAPSLETKEKEKEEDKEEKYEVEPDKKSFNDLVDVMLAIVDNNLNAYYRKLKSYDKTLPQDAAMIQLINTRIASLKAFQQIATKNRNNDEATVRASNFFNAVETVAEDVKKLNETVLKSMATFRKNAFDPVKGTRQVEEMYSAFIKAQDFNAIVEAMQEIINDAAANPENNISLDSEINKSIQSIRANIQGITSQYKKMAVKVWLNIAKTPGEQVYKDITTQLKQAYSPKLEALYDKKAKIEKGLPVNVFAKVKDTVYSLLNPNYKKDLENQHGAGVTPQLQALDKVSKEIQVVEAIMNGFDGSEESLIAYLEGASDPTSYLYVGHDSFVSDVIAHGRPMLANYIASAGNSDIAVATPVIMMKNAQNQASYNAMNDERLLKFDQIKNKLLKKYTLEQLNEAISEWREIPFYNKEKKEMDHKSVFFLAKPFSSEYEHEYKAHEINRRTSQDAYYVAEAEYHALHEQVKALRKGKAEAGVLSEKEIELAEKLEEVKEKRKAKEDAHKNYLEYIVKNSNKPYIDKFYTLQAALPEDIRNKINDLYFEQQMILYELGPEDAIDLKEESDFDRVKEIDIEIKRLREEAKERDPKYADYIDEFNELYEYDTNEDYYARKEKAAKIKYGANSPRFKKWFNENNVERPTQEWYNERNALYEERAELYEQLERIQGSSNPYKEELDALFEKKNQLLAPFKRFGRINPRYMDTSDIMEIDAVQDRIDQIMSELEDMRASRPKTKPSPPVKAILNRLTTIKNRLSEIVSEQLSPAYTELFEDKYLALEGKLRTMNIAKNALDVAQDKFDTDPSDENTKALEQADLDLQDAQEQFFLAEETFEQWYNKYHTNQYQSVADGFDNRSIRNPKAFNFEKIPPASVKDQYMETVPDPKYYKVKKLRKENWYLDGEHLHSSEIDALRKDATFDEAQAVADGRLIKKQGVDNPDYHKGPDNVLLPKGVRYEGNNKYSIAPGFEGDPNINDKFKSIQKNPEIKELYDALVDLYFSIQSDIEGKKGGYTIPGFEAGLIEKYKTSGSLAETIKTEAKLFRDKNFKAKGEIDYVSNVYGELGSAIRMRFVNQLPKELQSQDAITSIMKYTVEGHYNKGMQQVAPQVDSFIKYLELQRDSISKGPFGTGKTTTAEGEVVDMRQRVKSLDNTIQILDFERRKFITGQSEDDTHRSVKKVIDGLFAYTSFIRIGFDVANQVKNNLAGNIQAYIAAGNLKSNHYSTSDWMYGKRMLYGPGGFMANFFKDYGKVSDLSVSTMLYRFYNPAQKDPMKYFEEAGAGAKRRMAEKATSIMEMGYLLQDKGESEIAITVMYAILNNYKVKVLNPDGSYKKNADGTHATIPAHQVYKKGVNGELIKRSDVEFTTEQENRLRNTIYSEMRRAQGNYAKADMTKAEETIGGKVLFFYRKFLIPTFLNRFGWSRPNWESGEVAVGYWRAVFQMYKLFGAGNATKELLVGSKNLNRVGGHGLDNVIRKRGEGVVKATMEEGEMNNEFYIRQAAQARKDAWMMITLTIMSMIALGYVKRKDDDDEPLGIVEGNLFRILWSVRNETLSMFPVGGGSDEYIRNFTTAVPMVREVTKLKTMMNHAYSYVMAMLIAGGAEPDEDWDSQFYQEVWKDAFYSKKHGTYEKGDSKLYKDFMDLTGIRNFRDLFNPEMRIDQLKKKL
jgi:hypothetical protein